ncbi:GNAT family N-acetyltransferase [Salipaludibacillus neizhouensis]|uniref:GNAT family N-acetyltransferase n=1 Tax=Salipaludibacillus neizhouensis TaxID=885475 RepID=A0A3A9K1B2_9BACI|nr:GNAT family N-acetyltransferase [Salipaludibacillus neizhouensis]RKL64700.1 GNAT family N-acetyltransferase [Salipaludibacillus neizhouensis]
MKWTKDDFMISDDILLMNLDTVLHMLSETYWAKDRTKETVEKSIKNSISFGMYNKDKQIGFARVVTDKAVFSWILDVVIDEDYRRNGLGQWFMECILGHPEIKYTRFALATKDAHEFYKKFNFKENDCMTRGLIVE